MGQRWFLRDEFELQSFIDYAREEIANQTPLCVELTEAIRSNDQNDMLHAVIREIAEQKQDETFVEIKRYIKLHFGVPILRGSDKEFKQSYDRSIKLDLSYEHKLLAMDLLPVTRLLSRKQFSALIDEVIRYYTGEGYVIRSLPEDPRGSYANQPSR